LRIVGWRQDPASSAGGHSLRQAHDGQVRSLLAKDSQAPGRFQRTFLLFLAHSGLLV
jgi:hypothetical protein